jgi:hypothetical protein
MARGKRGGGERAAQVDPVIKLRAFFKNLSPLGILM